MTVENQTIKKRVNADNTTNPISFSFRVQQEADLSVYKILLTTGVKTLLTGGGVDYSVELDDDGEGGFVTPTVGIPSTYDLLLINEADITQPQDFPTEGSFNETSVEEGLDRACIINLIQKESLNRALKLMVEDPLNDDDFEGIFLPAESLDDRAGKIFGWNDTGDAIQYYAKADIDPSLVSSFITTLLDDANATEARATLGALSSAAGGVLTANIADANITNAKLADMAQATFKMRAAGAGTGVPIDGTATQATAALNAVVGDSGSGGTKGLVPAPGSGDAAAFKFLKADGAWNPIINTVIESGASGATANLSTTIPAGVSRITINLNAVSSNGTSGMQVQIGTGGSFVTSGYTSRSAYLFSGSNSQGSSSTGFIFGTASASGVYTGIMILTRVSGTNTWVMSLAAADTGQNGAGSGGGVITLAGALDRVRIATVNGTDAFDAGGASIFYE